MLRVSSSSSFVPRLDRCLKPVEIHIFEVRAAQLFVVSFVEPVEPNGIEDLPELSPVAKDLDERSFGGGAVHLERNGPEMLPLGLSCSKILSPRLLRSPRPYAVACLVDKKLTGERRVVRNFGTAAAYSQGGVMAKVTVAKRKPTQLQIANRAFEIYVSRGGDHGHDVGDWFEAERQLQTELQPKKRAVKQT